MSKKNPGKIFEDDFKKSFTDSIWIEREKDNINFGSNDNTRFTMSSDYDYRIFNGKTLYLLELKSTKLKSLPFSAFKKTDKYDQLIKLDKNNEYKNIIAGVIINYRTDNKTYFLNTSEVIRLRISSGIKSIPITSCEKYGTLIKQELKRVHYRYDCSMFEYK